MKKLISFSLFLGAASLAQAQDFHFAQSFLAPQIISPAATGHQSQHRNNVAMLFRGQWDNAASQQSYQGVAVVADRRFCLRDQHKNFYALGLVLQHDWSPLGGLSNTAARVSGAFHFNLGGETFASAGVALGLLDYRLDPGRLRFDEQYQNGNFDPANPSGEAIDRNGILQADMSGGGQVYNNYRGFSVGVAWHHLNQPKYSLIDGDNRLGIGWVLHGTFIPFRNSGNTRNILLHTLVRRQSFSGDNSAQWQTLLGGFYKVAFAGNSSARFTAGCYFRFGSSEKRGFRPNTFIPALQIGNDSFTAILSYDANLLPVRSRFAGGMELGINFNFGKTDRCINCPRM